MEKIKAIVKRPDEKYGHMTAVSNSLKNLQNIVGGHIEVVTLMPDKGLVMICNEDGKLLGLEKNFIWGVPPFHDVIVGEVIICGVEDEDFTDVPIDFKTWKFIIDKYNE